jgi:hypothetical protein
MAAFREGASTLSTVSKSGRGHYTTDGLAGGLTLAVVEPVLARLPSKLWRCRRNKRKIAGFPSRGAGV